jgi:hypothetical protein
MTFTTLLCQKDEIVLSTLGCWLYHVANPSQTHRSGLVAMLAMAMLKHLHSHGLIKLIELVCVLHSLPFVASS